MEIFDTTAPDSIGNEKEQNTKIGRSALKVFGTGATIVYGFALYYCYNTGHIMETGMLAGAYVLIGLMASKIYRSL